MRLREYFCGEWRMSRRIDDRRAARLGRAWGQAMFAQERPERAQETTCTESLTVEYGGRRWPAEQIYRWRFPDENIAQLYSLGGGILGEMKFEQLRHRWRSAFVHVCGEDRYQAEAHLESDRHWRLTWRVAGPRKDYTLDTEYARLPPRPHAAI